MAAEPLTDEQIETALRDLPDFRHSGGALVAAYRFGSAPDAVAYLGSLVQVAEERNHHPDADWRYDTIGLAISSHDAGGKVTGKDVALAGEAARLAAESGGRPAPDKAPGRG